MIASPRNPDLLAIVQKVAPGIVLIDETFQCQTVPAMPRFRLRQAYLLQKAMQPQRSVLLAPGESWDVSVRR